MRILTVGNMYPPHSLGGYELMWSSWVAHAIEAGHDVAVLTTDFRKTTGPIDPASDYAGDVSRELRWYWEDHRLPRFTARERWRIERHNASVVDRHLREFRPDAVVWWAMGGMSLSIIERVRRAGLPSMAVLADYWLQYADSLDAWIRPFKRHPRLAAMVEWATGLVTRVDVNAVTTFVFVSEAVRRRALEAWPGLGPSVVFHHGPDMDLFKPAPPHPWDGRIIYIGRMDPRKGVDLAIAAVARLEDVSLTILGSGDEEYISELNRMVDELGVRDRVAFEQRPRPELPAAYAAADVAVFPVRWAEPFGLVPLEAMAVGRPVIATGRGGSGEFLDDGRNCLLFDPGEEDPQPGAAALADAIRTLAQDAELRERLRSGGFETVNSLSSERFNQGCLDVLLRAAA